MLPEFRIHRPPVPPLRIVEAAGHPVPLYGVHVGQPDPALWIGLDALLAALSIPEAGQPGFIATAGLVAIRQGDVRTISPVAARLYVHNAERFGFVTADQAGAIRAALDLEETANAAV